MVLSIDQVIRFLSGLHVDPEQHTVLIDGIQKGRCTRASFRTVFSFKGVEFPVDYAYMSDGVETTLSSRLRKQGLGQGGREEIRVNGKDVVADDVLIGFEAGNGSPSAYVEFRYAESEGGGKRSVKFVAPLKDA
jgi:hypothetical protein